MALHDDDLLLDDATPAKAQEARGLVRRYKSLKGEHGTKFARLNELAVKADPTEAEETEAATLARECRELKGRMEGLKGTIGEFRSQLRERDVAVDRLPYPSRERQRPGDRPGGATRNGTRTIGTKEAGESTYDRKGEVQSEVGEGSFGERAWGAIQKPEFRSIFKNYLRTGTRNLKPAEKRVLYEAQDDYGGVFVPIDLLNEVITRKPTPTRLAGRVRRLNTSRDRVQTPRVGYADTNNQYSTPIRVTWTDEIPSSDTVHEVNQDDIDFGLETIPICTAMMSCPVSINLSEDTAFDIEAWLMREFGVTRDLLYDDMILNGDGNGQPWGILNTTGSAATQVPTTNVGNPVTADGVLDLTGLIEEQYDEDQIIVMRKTSTWRGIRKLKDASNRYLIGMGEANEGGLSVAGRRTVDGYPVLFSGFMPAAGAASKVIVSGAFGGYWLPERLGLSIQVLRETKAKRNQREILARLRFGGKVVQPWQFRVGVQS